MSDAIGPDRDIAIVHSAPDPRGATRSARSSRYLLNLSRRAEMVPADAELLWRVVGDRIAEYWESALQAAIQASQDHRERMAAPVIDAVIARALREKPNPKVVAELHNRLPLDSLSLVQTAVEVSRQMVCAMRERHRVGLYPLEYLTIWQDYILRLSQSGALDEARGEAAEALAFARDGFRRDQAVFRAGLAATLETWAVVAAECLDLAGSRAAREEEIGVLGEVAGSEAAQAQCLSNHSGVLKALGDAPAALQYSERAVELYRQIVAGRAGDQDQRTDYGSGLQAWQDDPRPHLGDALVGLSAHQNDAGQREACLGSAQEAVEVFAALSEDFPDQFTHHLAMARHNLGMAVCGVGDASGGLREIQEAARVYKRLVGLRPSAHAPTYARILSSLALAYAMNDLGSESLGAAEECAETCRRLWDGAPKRFADLLTRSLERLRVLYEAAGLPQMAAAVATEITAVESAATAADVPDGGSCEPGGGCRPAARPSDPARL